MKRIVVQGGGYVGAAFAVACAKVKKNSKYPFKVSIIEKKENINLIKKIKSGTFPFKTSDKKLQKLFSFHVNKNLHINSDIETYKKADVVISCISFDCSISKKNFIKNVKIYQDNIKEIAENISSNTLLIIQTTLPPGFTNNFIKKKIIKVFKKRKISEKKILLAHSFERVMPGANYLNSVTNNWRVCAGINESSIKKCKIFFSKIINIKKFPITYFNDPTYSETAKILENSYRATNISLIDEWSKFAEINNLNLWSIIDTIKVRPTHNNIMSPGFGVGGHCLTKDPKFIEISSKYILKESSSGFPQTSSALKINNSMPLNVFNKIRKYFLNKLNGKKVLILGVSYKAGVEDTRKTPTGILYDKLKKNGAQINLHDPLVRYWPEKKRIVDKTIPNFDNYNVVVLATNHKEYKKINIKYLNKFRKKILIIDTINFFKDKLSQDLKNNFALLSIGK